MFVRKYIKQEEAEPKEAGPAFTPEEIAALVAERDSLKAHHTKLLEETKAAKAAKAEQEKAALAASEEAARKAGDVDALDKSWQKKYAELEGASTGKVSAMQQQLNSILVDSVASSLAADIAVDADAAELLVEQIKKSLGAVEKDGKFVTVVLEEGKPSARTTDELKDLIKSNKKFARLVKGSPAGGAGGFAKEVGGGAANLAGGGSMLERAREIIKNTK